MPTKISLFAYVLFDLLSTLFIVVALINGLNGQLISPDAIPSVIVIAFLAQIFTQIALIAINSFIETRKTYRRPSN